MRLDERIAELNKLMSMYPKMKTVCRIGTLVMYLSHPFSLVSNDTDKKFKELEKLLKDL